ncbi:MAG: serine hydrolase domain-containing protein [Balneolaceae bacterium]
MNIPTPGFSICNSRFHIAWLFLVMITALPAVGQSPWLDQEQLDRFFEIGKTQSLMVEQDGELLFEAYRNGMHSSRPANIKSASKSVLSILIGIAIDKGYLESIHQPIAPFFEAELQARDTAPLPDLTIEDLLTMRSGLESTSFQNYGRWVLSSNWARHAITRPVVAEPGGRMVYSTGTSHLLSVLLTRATGMSTRSFARRYLFDPMGITVGGWDRDPQGYYMGGNNLALSPQALLKIGRMMMQLGEFEGRQIVSSGWVLDSVREITQSRFNGYRYGYMWWRETAGGAEVVFAWGNGGQYIFILPELDTVISITSDVNSGSVSRQYQREIFAFLGTVLVPKLAGQ